jgi:hypothetical protein
MRRIVWVREKDRLLDWPKLRARCSDCEWASGLLSNVAILAQKGIRLDAAARRLRRENIRQEFAVHVCFEFPARPM